MAEPRLADRAIVRLSPLDPGEDVREFLQGLLTNDVSHTLPVYAALLSAQGKTMFDLIVWDGGDASVLLDCEAEQAEALVKRLSLYRLRRKIAIELVKDVGVFWQATPRDDASLDPRFAELGYRWTGPISQSDEDASATWRRHRLKCGVPEGYSELGDVLWLETNAVELNGVSFEKGCYVGQENTARMNWRQKINRRLVVVPLVASDSKRQRAAYAELGLAVDHLRISDIDPAWVPGWMRLESESS